MNLLMVSGDRSTVAGKQGAFWYTLQELSRHWDRIDVICPRVPEAVVSTLHDNVTFYPSPRGLWCQPKWICRKGLELWRQHHYSCMTVHAYAPFYNGIGARCLHKKTGIPYALEVHHIVGHPQPASRSETIGLWMTQHLFAGITRRAAAVRVVNSTVGGQLQKWGVPEEKIQLVPSFYLDRELLTSIPEVPKDFDIAFCGRLVANKGIQELLEAVALLEGVKAVVIGDGPERQTMESAANELGIADRVVFTGWLPDQKAVLHAIKSAKVFVMNSKSEGGPRVLLEAMALGMPVVSTPVGIAPDVIDIGNNGLITTGTPQNLGARIQSLLRDSDLRERMGHQATRVLDQYEKSQAVAAYANFLKSLAS